MRYFNWHILFFQLIRLLFMGLFLYFKLSVISGVKKRIQFFGINVILTYINQLLLLISLNLHHAKAHVHHHEYIIKYIIFTIYHRFLQGAM